MSHETVLGGPILGQTQGLELVSSGSDGCVALRIVDLTDLSILPDSWKPVLEECGLAEFQSGLASVSESNRTAVSATVAPALRVIESGRGRLRGHRSG